MSTLIKPTKGQIQYVACMSCTIRFILWALLWLLLTIGACFDKLRLRMDSSKQYLTQGPSLSAMASDNTCPGNNESAHLQNGILSH